MGKLRAWITGAGGLIGRWLVRTAPTDNVHPIGLTRAELELTDFHALRERYLSETPAFVIHCAALSRSPACDANPNFARLLNVEVTAQLAGLCEGRSRLVFFSTDLVFDGRKGGYSEDYPVAPLGIYATTKVEAERIVAASGRHLIIRTSLNGGTSPTRDRGFNEQMLNAWRAGQKLRLFFDEFRSPIAAEVTARAAWELALNAAPGVYHVAGSERLSRVQLGELLASRWPQVNPQFESVSLADYKGSPRAPDTSLNCAKAQALLTFELPKFSEWLAKQPHSSF